MKYPTPHPKTVRSVIEAIDSAIKLKVMNGHLNPKDFSSDVAQLLRTLAKEAGDDANVKDLLEPLWAEVVRRAPRLSKEVIAEVLRTRPEDPFEVQVEAAKKIVLPGGDDVEKCRREFIDTVLVRVFKEGSHSYIPMTPYNKNATSPCLEKVDDWVLLGTWSVVTRAIMDLLDKVIANMVPDNGLVH